MTHMQSNRRTSPSVTVGDVVREAGKPHLSARVTSATASTVTVEYTSGDLTGEEFAFGVGEFGEVFVA